MQKNKVWTVSLQESELVKLDQLACWMFELGKITSPKRSTLLRESLLRNSYESARELINKLHNKS